MNKTPKQRHGERVCGEVSTVLGDELPSGVGFALAVFDFAGSFMTYASTGERADVIRQLRNLLEALEEGRVEPAGATKVRPS